MEAPGEVDAVPGALNRPLCPPIASPVIDNHDSQDLNRVECKCMGRELGIQVRIAITDVDALVTKGSRRDRSITHNGKIDLHRHMIFPMPLGGHTRTGPASAPKMTMTVIAMSEQLMVPSATLKRTYSQPQINCSSRNAENARNPIRPLSGIVRIQAVTIRRATPHFTYFAPLVAPTPMMEDDMICVVLTGIPAREAPMIVAAPAVSAVNPWTGRSLVIP